VLAESDFFKTGLLEPLRPEFFLLIHSFLFLLHQKSPPPPPQKEMKQAIHRARNNNLSSIIANNFLFAQLPTTALRWVVGAKG
jgi:hypothetical protein